MDSTDRAQRLGNEKIGRLLLDLAIPAIIAQLVSVLYNMVDRVFIGRMENGTVAMSALSVTLPVITLVTAVTQLLGVGGSPLAAIRLGAKDIKAANKIVTNSFVCLIASGVVMTAGIIIFAEPMLRLFGAMDENIQMAVDYTVIYAMGTIFVQITLGMNSYINTQGYAKLGMVTVLIGALLNIVLDPIFIFVLDMGVKGAAWATIISQGVSAVWVTVFFFSKKSMLKIKKEYVIPDIKIVLSICALGVSPFIMSLTESLLQISFNNQLSLYGGTMAVGTMSVLLSLKQMILLPVNGLTQGAQPILSYNYGAGNLDRVRKTFRLLLVCCVGFAASMGIMMMVFAETFGKIFTKDPQLLKMVTWAAKAYFLGNLVYGAQGACQQSFLALGQAGRSLLMALFRKVIVLIPLIYILPATLGGTAFAAAVAEPVAALCSDGGRVFAVFLSESIADTIAAITTAGLFFAYYKKHLMDK